MLQVIWFNVIVKSSKPKKITKNDKPLMKYIDSSITKMERQKDGNLFNIAWTIYSFITAVIEYKTLVTFVRYLPNVSIESLEDIYK
jgi:hypothetical protein